MKRVIGWPVAWGLCLLGDVISRPINRWDACAWMYPAYSRVMCASVAVNDWAGLDIWRRVK